MNRVLSPISFLISIAALAIVVWWARTHGGKVKPGVTTPEATLCCDKGSASPRGGTKCREIAPDNREEADRCAAAGDDVVACNQFLLDHDGNLTCF
jgi:hypothetical protein